MYKILFSFEYLMLIFFVFFIYTENSPIFLLFPDNELYSGTVADFSGTDPIIYREPLQTEQYDSLSLNGE